MALTQVKTTGLADDAVTADKLANAINTERTANTAKTSLEDNAVTLAKMAAGTDGQIITYDASGDPVAVGPGTDGQVLTSTGAGSPPAFEALPASNNYTHPNHSGEVTSTADGAQVVADDVIDEANLKADNSPTNDYVLTAKSSAAGGLTWAAVASGGLTEADNWRITSDFSGSADPISSNLERVDGTLQPSTQLGSGMSVSSGVWTFPSTGYWHVSFYHTFNKDGSTRWVESYISSTADNGSNWDHRIGFAQSHITKDSSINWHVFTSQVASTLLDITDTSNHKIRFGTDAGSSVTTYGSTDDSRSHFIFMKLGDT